MFDFARKSFSRVVKLLAARTFFISVADVVHIPSYYCRKQVRRFLVSALNVQTQGAAT